MTTLTVPRFALLAPSGTLITPVPTGFAGDVLRVQTDADGRILVSGRFNLFFGVTSSPAKVARMSADGVRDITHTGAVFDSDSGTSAASVQSMLSLADGRTLVGGFFTSVDGTARNYLALLQADGTLDTTFADIGIGGSAKNVLFMAPFGPASTKRPGAPVNVLRVCRQRGAPRPARPRPR